MDAAARRSPRELANAGRIESQEHAHSGDQVSPFQAPPLPQMQSSEAHEALAMLASRHGSGAFGGRVGFAGGDAAGAQAPTQAQLDFRSVPSAAWSHPFGSSDLQSADSGGTAPALPLAATRLSSGRMSDAQAFEPSPALPQQLARQEPHPYQHQPPPPLQQYQQQQQQFGMLPRAYQQPHLPLPGPYPQQGARQEHLAVQAQHASQAHVRPPMRAAYGAQHAQQVGAVMERMARPGMHAPVLPMQHHRMPLQMRDWRPGGQMMPAVDMRT